MSTILVPLLIAGFIGYQLDEAKLKKYDMMDENGDIVKVQFSKKNVYSCPLSCELEHYHYAEKRGNEETNSSNVWSIQSSKDLNGLMQYTINGQSVNSYKMIKVKRIPKSAPSIAFEDISAD